MPRHAPRPIAGPSPAPECMAQPPGYTVAVCAAGACAKGADKLLDALRPLIRRRAHAVLVRAGCVAQGRTCLAGSGGPMMHIQPCTPTRGAIGPSVLLGPVRTSADVRAVCRWLQSTDLSPAALPVRLRRPPLPRGSMD